MSIVSVEALSLSKARALRPARDALMVSVLGAQEQKASRRPPLSGWRSALVLDFEDVSEESVLTEPGIWPLEPDRSDHQRLLGSPMGEVPSLSHAQKIVEFLLKHQSSSEQLRLIVHCQAGVSRSVMIAHKAAQWCGLEVSPSLANRSEFANQRLGRLLEAAREKLDLNGVFLCAPSGKKPSP